MIIGAVATYKAIKSLYSIKISKIIMPKISIIVPCWGVEKYLNRCVESLVGQTFKDIEIILVDDESPDRVPEMCDDWAQIDSRIRVIHKKNGGLGMACNSGIDVATGEYIAFCDSDDWVNLDTYERLYLTAQSTNADAVYSGIQMIDDAGIVRPLNQPSTFEVMTNRARILEMAMDMICSKAEDPIESHIAMSAKIVLYRRALIEKNNLRFESEREFITEDLIWNLDILGHASIVTTLPNTFYYYYDNSSSISKKIRLDRFPFFKTNRDEIRRRTSKMRFPSNVQERIDRMYIRFLRHQVGDIMLSSHTSGEKKRVVTEMLTDETTQKVFSTYPVSKLTKQQQVIIYLMKHNCQLGLRLLFKIRR